MDLTYIPMARGFVYLSAVVGWFSRRVLSSRLSITREADFCIEALGRHSKPDIFNIDQGSQFTSIDFTAVLKKAKKTPSRWTARALGGTMSSSNALAVGSNTRRSISTPTKPCPRAPAGIGRYLIFYNSRRPHSSLDRQTPDQALLQRASTNDGGGMMEAETHLAKRPKLLRQTEPPLP
jgi:putative transposase